MTSTGLSARQRFVNILRGMLRRNLPIALLLLTIEMIVLPLQSVYEIQMLAENVNYYAFSSYGSFNLYSSVSGVIMLLISVVAPLAVSLMHCSYIHSRRAVDFYHSLPITRDRLFCASFISSLATVSLPFCISWFTNLGVKLYGVSYLNTLGNDLSLNTPMGIAVEFIGWLTAMLVITAVVFFVSTQVGSVFENFIFAAELLLAPLVLRVLNNNVYSELLAGYSSLMDTETLCRTSPVTLIVAVNEYVTSGRVGIAAATVFIWLLLGIGFFLLTLKCYRLRRSELAETAGCRSFLGVVFTAIAVYVASPVIGMIFFYNGNELLYLAGVLIGSILSFIFVEAVLNRGFVGLRSRARLGVCICAFVTAVAVAISTGGLGYEKRIPQLSSVDSVSIDYNGWYNYVNEKTRNVMPDGTVYWNNVWQPTVTLHTPQAIEQVQALHSKLIETALNKNTQSGETEDQSYHSTRIYNIEYNGSSKLLRRYYSDYSEISEEIAALDSNSEFLQAVNPLFHIAPEQLTAMDIYDELGFYSSTVRSKEEISGLLAAMVQDCTEQGTEPLEQAEPVVGYIFFNMYEPRFIEPDSSNEVTIKNYASFSVPIFASYTETISRLGDKLPPQVSVDEVTSVGVDGSLYNELRFVTQLSALEPAAVDKEVYYEYGAFTTKDTIKRAIENRKTTRALTNTNRTISIRMYKGDQAGAVFLLNYEDIPEEMLTVVASF